MKNYLANILLIPLVALALTPPIFFKLDCLVNSTAWLLAIFVSGFLAFLFLNFKVSIWLKLLVIWCFVSCFLSRAPFISFTLNWSVIFCAYYYVACTKIKDFTPVKRVVQAIFFFVTLLIIMQLFGKDTLLNFGLKTPVILGTVGNSMISSSYVCTMAPFLIVSPLNWILLLLIAFISKSSGAVLAIFMGLLVIVWAKLKRWRMGLTILLVIIPLLFAFKTGKIKTFGGNASRRLVWTKSIELTLKRPIGYGGATWKILFPYMCGKEISEQQPGREWARAHCFPIQLAFELGIPGLILFIGWITSIAVKVIKSKNYIKLAGLSIIVGTSMVHFPDRMVNSVLILVMFLAWLSSDSHERQYDYYC